MCLYCDGFWRFPRTANSEHPLEGEFARASEGCAACGVRSGAAPGSVRSAHHSPVPETPAVRPATAIPPLGLTVTLPRLVQFSASTARPGPAAIILRCAVYMWVYLLDSIHTHANRPLPRLHCTAPAADVYQKPAGFSHNLFIVIYIL